MSECHHFVTWLGQQENDVYRAFLRDYIGQFPARGDRTELRAVVEADDREVPPNEWRPLDLFDHAWRLYRPYCAAPDCTNFVGLGTDWCADHELEVLL